MEQIERIKAMEQNLDKVSQTVDETVSSTR